MTLQVISQAVSVYKTTGTSPDGQRTAEEQVFLRGQLLPDWVDSFQAFTLVSCGMAAEVGDNPDGALRPVTEEPAPVLLPEHSPNTYTGSQPMYGDTGTVVTDTSTDTDTTDEDGLADLPEDTATKPVWEDFAVQSLPSGYRMTRAEAESYKKADLVTEVKARHQEATDLGSDQLPPAVV